MKQQHFPWMVLLLLIIGLVDPSFGGWRGDKADPKCDSNGILGTFGQNGKFDRLTITPVNFTKDLTVDIRKNGTDFSTTGIQLYLTLDQQSSCINQSEKTLK